MPLQVFLGFWLRSAHCPPGLATFAAFMHLRAAQCVSWASAIPAALIIAPFLSMPGITSQV